MSANASQVVIKPGQPIYQKQPRPQPVYQKQAKPQPKLQPEKKPQPVSKPWWMEEETACLRPLIELKIPIDFEFTNGKSERGILLKVAKFSFRVAINGTEQLLFKHALSRLRPVHEVARVKLETQKIGV